MKLHRKLEREISEYCPAQINHHSEIRINLELDDVKNSHGKAVVV
ncbi:hypothetical protein [Paraglaciecola sp. L1A13]|nr:hypothetical protein [Paraglaciecola sp. L1A13]